MVTIGHIPWMTPPTTEQITALEQWARERCDITVIGPEQCDATLALCETVRAQQAALDEATGACHEWAALHKAAVARAEQAERARDEARLSNTVTEHHTIQQLSAALTEARRVLRAQDECMVCKAELFRDLTVPHCFDCVVEDEHADEWDAICAAKAAVLAQEEK